MNHSELLSVILDSCKAHHVEPGAKRAIRWVLLPGAYGYHGAYIVVEGSPPKAEIIVFTDTREVWSRDWHKWTMRVNRYTHTAREKLEAPISALRKWVSQLVDAGVPSGVVEP